MVKKDPLKEDITKRNDVDATLKKNNDGRKLFKLRKEAGYTI